MTISMQTRFMQQPQVRFGNWGWTTNQDGDRVPTFNGKPVYTVGNQDGDPAIFTRNGQRVQYDLDADGNKLSTPVHNSQGQHVMSTIDP